MNDLLVLIRDAIKDRNDIGAADVVGEELLVTFDGVDHAIRVEVI